MSEIKQPPPLRSKRTPAEREARHEHIRQLRLKLGTVEKPKPSTKKKKAGPDEAPDK